MPEHFSSDLLAVGIFGVVLVLLITFGVKLADYLWKKVDLEGEVAKGNVSAGIVMAAMILGMCYALSRVVVAIIGG